MVQGRRLVAYRREQLEVEEFPVPSPEQLEPGEVLLEAARTVISTGTELANFAGITVQRQPLGDDWREQPYRPGYSFAGTVLAIGEGVAAVQPGDRVFASAPHASHHVHQQPDDLTLIPSNVSFDHACFSSFCNITLNGVRRGRPQLGEAVAVVGLGLIGQMTLQFARLSGGRPVVGTDFFAPRRALAERCGATAALDPSAPDFEDRINELTRGERFACVWEATGSPQAFTPALRLAARGGRVVALGSTRGVVSEVDLYGDIHRPGVTVIGAHASTTPAYDTFYHPWTRARNYRLGLELMADGSLQIEALISHRIAPGEAPAIFAALLHHRDDYMGVVIDWTR